MLAREIMTQSVVTVPTGTTLRTAVEQMATEEIGCLIVTQNDDPAGIVTTTDAMHAGAVTDRSFGDISLDEVASSPLVTVGPREPIRDAIARMRRENVTKLPVVDGLELVGIVTMTDVVHNYDAIVKQAQNTAADRDRWDS